MSIIKLVTTDGKEIEVEDFYLKAQSSVIRDMLSIPVPSSDDPKDITLDIKLDSALAQILVDFVTKPHIDVHIATLGEAEKLLDACDFFAFEALRKSTLLALENFDIPKSAIWDFFCTASRYKAPKVARAALRAVDTKNHILRSRPTERLSMDMAQECELDYLLGYYDAVHKWRESDDADSVDWQEAARRFEPRPSVISKV